MEFELVQIGFRNQMTNKIEQNGLILNLPYLRMAVPVKKGVDGLGLSQHQRLWIQVRMWELFNLSVKTKKDIEWSEIYASLSEMRNIHKIFSENIGPHRSKSADLSDEQVQLVKKVLLLGDIDSVVAFFTKNCKKK